MFALLTVKNLRKIQMIGLGSVTSLCREKKAKHGRGSVVLGLLRVCVSGFMYLITHSFY